MDEIKPVRELGGEFGRFLESGGLCQFCAAREEGRGADVWRCTMIPSAWLDGLRPFSSEREETRSVSLFDRFSTFDLLYSECTTREDIESEE